MTHPKVFVFVASYGSDTEKAQLVERITSTTPWHAYVADTGSVVIPMRASELGSFALDMASDDQLNWIEYTFQVES